MSSRNRGINLAKEAAEQDGSEHKFGATSPDCIYAVPEPQRAQYLPRGERQRGLEDFMDCATRGPHNILETKFTYAYRSLASASFLMKQENAEWLLKKGYVITRDGLAYVEFSDRFNAIKSGTDREGNSMKAPHHSIHKNGLIPKKMLPAYSQMTFDQYHNSKDITKAMEALGKEFLTRWPIFYEQVHLADLEALLTRDVMGLAGHAWPEPDEQGIYPRTEDEHNHVFMAFALPKTLIFDNYEDSYDEDWIKKLAPDYSFREYGYRIYVAAEHTPAEYKSLLERLLGFLNELLQALTPPKSYDQDPATLPMNQPPEAPVVNPKPRDESKVETWAHAIESFEGFAPGTRAYRNNNPGNLKYSASYKLVTGKDKDGFCLFATYEDGLAALCDYLTRAATGRHQAYKPEMTLVEFFGVYAPDGNRIVSNYAAYVASHLAVSVSTKIKDLV